MIPPDVRLLFLPEETSTEILKLRELNKNLVTLTAHQLGAPLTHILGYLRLWQETSPLVERSELDLVVAQAVTLQERLEDILLLAQLEAGLWQLEPELVYVQRIVSRVMDSQRRRMWDKQVHLASHLNCNRPLWADPEMLFHALGQLVSNAYKFSRPGGNVFIHVECQDRVCNILVTDEGLGISEEMQARLFEPSFQLNATQLREQSGLGIGLKLVRTIVEKHGGTLDVMSQLGSGTTFTLTLPVV